MITAQQIRAARAMVALPAERLAADSGLSLDDLDAIERGETAGDMAALQRLRNALEAQGIVFLRPGEDDPGVGPGLRLRNRAKGEGTRPEDLSSDNDG
jgi:transcriptional regulator with XRE-family HTH domain